MEHNRKTKMITIAILVVIAFGLSIGFAVYSRNLNIQNVQASVAGNPSNFDVVLSTSSTSASTGTVTGSYSRTNSDSTGSGGTATLNGTTISNLTATFTKGAGSVKYTFYAYNKGSITAYLNSAKIQGNSCKAINADESLVAAACRDIELIIGYKGSAGTSFTGGATTTDIPFYNKPGINSGESVEMSITIDYYGDHAVDGDFLLAVPDISLEFKSQPLVM